ncbi:MAG: hypothetical protein K8I29_01370 [Alphaproteobacteria bacterium]|uniref:Uncharacterized protein n=1 Tax=Candidatus Nitrobium versatile TaxID=2884831 RepID=A0A953LYX2_9BACT|nr:hypothetical protein [Candidatus Nitrobium versatile]
MIDPQNRVRERLEACFIYLSYATPDIREDIGIQGLSQVWIDTPAWYLWVKGRPGAFMIETVESGCLEEGNIVADSGLMAVRYFPSPGEEVFRDFSPGERALRKSSLFDITGTPRFEGVKRVRAGLYHIANLECLFGNRSQWMSLILDAPLLLTQPPGEFGATPAADTTEATERAIPAYALSLALYDTLVKMFTYFLRRTPAAHGDAVIEDGRERISCSFFSRTDCSGIERFLSSYTGVHMDSSLRKNVKPEWKKIALMEHRSHLTSLCGCKSCG